MRTLVQSVQRLLGESARAARLNQRDYLALLRLVAAGGLTGAELGRELDMTGSSISELADRLEQAGLIARRRPLPDRRLVVLTPTAAGRRRIERTLGPVLARVANVVDRVDEDELATVWRFLGDLADALRPDPP